MEKSVSIVIYPRSYNKRGDVSLHSVQGVTPDGIEVNIKLRVDGRAYPFGAIPSIKELSRTDIKAKNACMASPFNSKDNREGVLLFTNAKLDLNNRRGIPSYVARWGQVLATDSDANSPLFGPGRFFCISGYCKTSVVGKSIVLDSDYSYKGDSAVSLKYTFDGVYGYLIHLPDRQFDFTTDKSGIVIGLGGEYSDYRKYGFSFGFSIKAIDHNGAVVKETYQEHLSEIISVSILEEILGLGFDRVVITPIVYKTFSLQKDCFLKNDEDLNEYLLSLIDENEEFGSYRSAIRQSENPLYSFFRLSESVFHPARLSANESTSHWFSHEPKPTHPIDGAIVRSGIHGIPVSRSLWLIIDGKDSSIDSRKISDDSEYANGALLSDDNSLDEQSFPREMPIEDKELSVGIDNNGPVGAINVEEHVGGDVFSDWRVEIMQGEIDPVDDDLDVSSGSIDVIEHRSEESVTVSQSEKERIPEIMSHNDSAYKKSRKKGMADFIRRQP